MRMNNVNEKDSMRRRRSLASVAEDHVCEMANATLAWFDGMSPRLAGCPCEVDSNWAMEAARAETVRRALRRIARFVAPALAAVTILLTIAAPRITAKAISEGFANMRTEEEAFDLVTPQVSADFLAARKTRDFHLDLLREAYFRRSIPFGSIIYQEAVSNELPPELVAAVVMAESSFRPSLVSHRNAHGLMQLIPSTAEQMGVADIMSPRENIRAGTKYLRYLHDRFDGDRSLALAAYNAGEGNVDRYGGVPPFRETRGYLKKVNRYQKQYQLKVASSAARWKRVRFNLAR